MTASTLCLACQKVLTAEEAATTPGQYCAVCRAAQAGAAPTSSPASIFAVVMMIAGTCSGIYGVILTFQDPSTSDKIVGGDAFNYQIYAARGLVVMAGGILLVLLGLTAATLSNYRRR